VLPKIPNGEFKAITTPRILNFSTLDSSNAWIKLPIKTLLAKLKKK